MKESILTRVTRRPLSEPDQRAHQQHGDDRGPPGQALPLQPDRQHLGDAEVEPGREVEMVGGHRDEDGQRHQRLDRFVVEDRLDVEEGRGRCRACSSEKTTIRRIEQDQQAPDRDRAGDRGADIALAIGCRSWPAPPALRCRRRPRRSPSAARWSSSSAGNFRDDAAAAEDQRAVADALDLLEIRRDQEDGQPRLQRLLEQMIDLRLGADIDADGRLLEDEQARPSPPSSGPPRPSADCRRRGWRPRCSGSCGLDGEALEHGARCRPAPPCARSSCRTRFPGRHRVQIDVLARPPCWPRCFPRRAGSRRSRSACAWRRRDRRIDRRAVERDMAAPRSGSGRRSRGRWCDGRRRAGPTRPSVSPRRDREGDRPDACAATRVLDRRARRAPRPAPA